MTQSEVSRLLRRIEQDYALARRGLSGLARHAFIAGKMKCLERCQPALCGLLGEQEATRLGVERLERV